MKQKIKELQKRLKYAEKMVNEQQEIMEGPYTKWDIFSWGEWCDEVKQIKREMELLKKGINNANL